MGRIFKRKKFTTSRLNAPVPLVEALGRSTPAPSGWRVEAAAHGMAHTDIRRGVMAVPLEDEVCPKCKVTHGPSIRSHEMTHVAISPVELPPLFISKELRDATKDANGYLLAKLITDHIMASDVYEPTPGSWPVEPEYQIAAEEYVVGTVMQRSSMYTASQYVCFPQIKATLTHLVGANSVREAVLLAASEGYNSNVIKLMQKMSRGTYLTAAKKRSPADFEKASELANWIAWAVLDPLRQINYLLQRKGYATRKEHLQAQRDCVAILIACSIIELDRKRREEAEKKRPVVRPKMEEKEKPEPEDVYGDSDLGPLLDHHGDKDLVEDMMRMLMKGIKPEETTSKYDRWGAMTIETPPLTRRLPEWKRRRIARATEEGSMPGYMHRMLIDGRVFRTTRKGDTGLSVLIDGSGSMGFTKEQIDTIIAKVPGTVIAFYCGDRAEGILRILAKEGKRVNDDRQLRPPHHGNIVDYPALEWLSKQPEPRLWISDGWVTTIGDGGASAVRRAEVGAIQKKARINRVENVEQALEIIDGKRALER